MNKIVLLLGGNLGNIKYNFEQALKYISKNIGTVSNTSNLYQSKAWGFESKDLFLNQVVLTESTLSPIQLLEQTQSIENLVGRKKKTRNLEYSSRLIDIDILFYNNEIIESDRLSIPHPRLHLRNFTLFPLQEILPDYTHPKLKKSITWLTENSVDKSECTKTE